MKNSLKDLSTFVLVLSGSILTVILLAMALHLDILAPLVWLNSCLKLIIYIVYYYTQFGVLSDLVLLAILFFGTKFLIDSLDKFRIRLSKQLKDTDDDMEIE